MFLLIESDSDLSFTFDYGSFLRVQLKRGIDHIGAHLPDQEGELVAGVFQVVGEDGVVDGEERLLGREHDGKCCKVPLKSEKKILRQQAIHYERNAESFYIVTTFVNSKIKFGVF